MEPLEDRAAFESLYVRWRFGDPAAGEAAVRLGRSLVDLPQGKADLATLYLKIGLLLKGQDPQAAQTAIDQARALGAPIPRMVAAQDESQAPSGVEVETDRRLIQAASTRTFRPPLGDPWHPAFDLAASSLPPLTLSVVPGGWISVDISEGLPQVYVYDADQRLVPSLSTGGSPFLTDAQSCEGPLVLLDDVFGGFNVAHCLFDKFPRLQVYEGQFPGQRLTGLMFMGSDYYRDALAHFGHGVMMPSGPRWTVRAEQLAVLSNHRRGDVMHPGFSGADWALDFIGARLQSAQLGARRLYVSRQDAAVRRLVNESEVSARFEAAGFEVCTLSGLSFDAQRALFSQAGHIAGVHGAGLANHVFAAAGARMLEIMPPLGGTFAYWVMTQGLRQSYRLLTAEDAELSVLPGASYDPALGARPIKVDLDRLDEALRAFVA